MDDYDDIFSAYVEELEAAKDEVMQWWDALLAAASPSGDPNEAQQAVRPRWPAGPAGHPRIIDVFRRHYLAIERLNEEKEGEKESQPHEADDLGSGGGSGWGEADEDEPAILSPQVLLFERLADEEPELAKFMQYFVFISIGIDPDGRIT